MTAYTLMMMKMIIIIKIKVVTNQVFLGCDNMSFGE